MNDNDMGRGNLGDVNSVFDLVMLSMRYFVKYVFGDVR